MLWCCVAFCAGDTIILKNGTSLEGDVILYKSGKLTLRTPDGKTRTGDIGSIQEIRFSHPVKPTETADRAAPSAPVQNKPVKSLSQIFQRIPSNLQPHKDLRSKNPLLTGQLRDWLKGNAYGERVALPSCNLLAIDSSRNDFNVSAKDFHVGGSKYLMPSGVRCTYPGPRDFRGDPDEREKLKERDRFISFLSTLNVAQKDSKSLRNRGSVLTVTGTIRHIRTARREAHGGGATCELEITLEDVDIAEFKK